MTDARANLVAQARDDPEAFGRLYDHYLPRVFAFCRLRCSSREEAEDLTSLTFERAFAAIGRYNDRGKEFSSWLFRIADNAAKDRARRTARVREVNAEVDQIGASQLSDWEEAFTLRSQIDSLPGDQRTVIRLRFYEDKSFADIGNLMGRSEGAAKQLLRRALHTLSQRIADEEASHERP